MKVNIKKEKDKLFEILKENKKETYKALILSMLVSLVFLVVEIMFIVNLFIALSHDTFILVSSISLTTALSIAIVVSFFYSFIKLNVPQVNELDVTAIKNRDIKYSIVFVVLVIVSVAIILKGYIL